MISVIQRVQHASIIVGTEQVASIQEGIVALIGIAKEDSLAVGKRLIERILNYRIFADEQGKMNRSLLDIKGALLLVSQFTLVADTKTGTRPGFSVGMSHALSEVLFKQLVDTTAEIYPNVQAGPFGADMAVNLCNNGPATFILNQN